MYQNKFLNGKKPKHFHNQHVPTKMMASIFDIKQPQEGKVHETQASKLCIKFRYLQDYILRYITILKTYPLYYLIGHDQSSTLK